ncbi:MAG TPA: DUF4198 domain-containing protein [Gammaproteobacteria bacterium]
MRPRSGRLRVAAAVLIAGAAAPAAAHFQMLYMPETALEAGGATHVVMLFTHPAHGGPSMSMGAPDEFYVVSQRGEDAAPVRRDLREHLTPIAWQSEDGKVDAYEARLPRSVMRSLGDYVFVLVPSPYYEAGEDKYIQQLTKTIANVGGVPGNWAEPVGLPAEILPLDKPYANWTGGIFRGIVLANGEPVPHAELEVEYMNHPPDLDAHALAADGQIEFPQGSFATMSIRANERGEFAIGLPRAGWWGVCALGVGPDTEHDGKPLSQDAVLWIQVKDMQ